MIDSVNFLRPGDKVRIVSEWDWDGKCGQNLSGLMDRWLGQIMTVREVYEDDWCFMEEDKDTIHVNEKGGWAWNRYCIEEIVTDDHLDEIDAVSNDDYMGVLMS